MPGLHQQGQVRRHGRRAWPRPPGIKSTPTVRINGEDFTVRATPDALVAKVKEIVGDVPGLMTAGRACSDATSGTAAGAVTVTAESGDRAAARRRPPPTSRRSGVRGAARASAVWVLIAGVVGLAAALTLTIEKIEILINPDYVPSCSINPVLSCGSVMITPQASAFGFPNPLIGIVAFTVVVVTGVLALAKVRLPRWYWAGLAVGHAARRRVRALADLPEPVPHRRAVPVLHGGVGGDDPAAGRGASIALQPSCSERRGAGAAHVALVAGGAVVHRADSDDPRAVLELLVDADLNGAPRG